MAGAPVCGVLALQGDFAEHLAILESLGTISTEVRRASELERLDALIIPGGESTTILKLLDRFSMRDPLVQRIEEGMAVLGTCAGGIVLASEASDGEKPLGVLDIKVVRNAYGRQVNSFEGEVEVSGLGPIRAAFIRAPIFEEPGEGVEVLATRDGKPVLVRRGKVVAATFHPEAAGETRLHRWFLEEVCGGSD